MSDTIWKFPMPTDEQEFHLEVPAGAQLLTVRVQRESAVAWFRCNDEETNRQLVGFRWAATGGTVPTDDRWRYLTTLQFNKGNYVLHLFVWEGMAPVPDGKDAQ